MPESAKPKVWLKYSDARPPMVGDIIRLHGAIEKWRGKPMKVSHVGRKHDPVSEIEQEGVWVETVGRDSRAHHRCFEAGVLEYQGELVEPAPAPAPPPPEPPKKAPRAAAAEG